MLMHQQLGQSVGTVDPKDLESSIRSHISLGSYSQAAGADLG